MKDALSIPCAPLGFVKTRVVSDMRTGHTLAKQIHRSLRNPRDVRVVLEVHHHSDEAAKSWEEQDRSQATTKYRALAARLNFLAGDRPDQLLAAKECSRRMRKPRNKDWEAIKRVCRYLIGCPRIVHSRKC